MGKSSNGGSPSPHGNRKKRSRKDIESEVNSDHAPTTSPGKSPKRPNTSKTEESTFQNHLPEEPLSPPMSSIVTENVQVSVPRALADSPSMSKPALSTPGAELQVDLKSGLLKDSVTALPPTTMPKISKESPVAVATVTMKAPTVTQPNDALLEMEGKLATAEFEIERLQRRSGRMSCLFGMIILVLIMLVSVVAALWVADRFSCQLTVAGMRQQIGDYEALTSRIREEYYVQDLETRLRDWKHLAKSKESELESLHKECEAAFAKLVFRE